jgi:hypothetical protein
MDGQSFPFSLPRSTSINWLTLKLSAALSNGKTQTSANAPVAVPQDQLRLYSSSVGEEEVGHTLELGQILDMEREAGSDKEKNELIFFMAIDEEPLSLQIRRFLKRYMLFSLNKVSQYSKVPTFKRIGAEGDGENAIHPAESSEMWKKFPNVEYREALLFPGGRNWYNGRQRAFSEWGGNTTFLRCWFC